VGPPGPRLTTRLDPAVAAVRAAVRACLADLPDDALVLVGCSGGADSLALSAATAFTAPRCGLRAGAVVVDHGWFAGSDRVAREAAQTCRRLGLDPVEVVRAGAPPTGVGPEAAARAVRYRALEDAVDRLDAAAVLLGHTLDDQAETVLLGLTRGSGGRSLAGMPPRRGRFRRPLLSLPRTTTRAACDALGLRPWEDPANDDPAFTRTRLRSLMPELEAQLGPGVVSALARTADLLAEDVAALEGLARELLERAASAGADGPDAASVTSTGSSPISAVDLRLDVATLAAEPDAVRRRALLEAARRAGSPPGALSRRHALAMDALVVDWRGQGAVHLPGGVLAERACGRLVVASHQRRRGTESDQE
jgi:tRNA(Ile)-lysidine synthetase-like protein